MAGTGGKRAGAGRPKTKLSRTVKPLKKVTAEEVLAEVDEKLFWHDLLTATQTISVVVIHQDEEGNAQGEPAREMQTVPDNKIRIDALKYLTNRRDGMPKQAVEMEHGGSVILQHTVPRPKR